MKYFFRFIRDLLLFVCCTTGFLLNACPSKSSQHMNSNEERPFPNMALKNNFLDKAAKLLLLRYVVTVFNFQTLKELFVLKKQEAEEEKKKQEEEKKKQEEEKKKQEEEKKKQEDEKKRQENEEKLKEEEKKRRLKEIEKKIDIVGEEFNKGFIKNKKDIEKILDCSDQYGDAKFCSKVKAYCEAVWSGLGLFARGGYNKLKNEFDRITNIFNSCCKRDEIDKNKIVYEFEDEDIC